MEPKWERQGLAAVTNATRYAALLSAEASGGAHCAVRYGAGREGDHRYETRSASAVWRFAIDAAGLRLSLVCYGALAEAPGGR
jgi:hypothetical protein